MRISPLASLGTVNEVSSSLSPLKSTVATVSPSAVKVIAPPLIAFPWSSVRLAVKLAVSPKSTVTVLLAKNMRTAFTLPPLR